MSATSPPPAAWASSTSWAPAPSSTTRSPCSATTPCEVSACPKGTRALARMGSTWCRPAWLLRALSNSPVKSRGAGGAFFWGVEVQQQPSLQCARPARCRLLLADLWSVITSPFIPKYLSAPRCATLHGLIYLIGDNTKKVHVYDPEANIWQKVPTRCSRGTAFTPRSDFRQFVLIFPAPPSHGVCGAAACTAQRRPASTPTSPIPRDPNPCFCMSTMWGRCQKLGRATSELWAWQDP